MRFVSRFFSLEMPCIRHVLHDSELSLESASLTWRNHGVLPKSCEHKSLKSHCRRSGLPMNVFLLPLQSRGSGVFLLLLLVLLIAAASPI